MARRRERDGHWEGALERLRAVCAALPGAVETLSYGNPAFKLGRKTFAVLDVYRGGSCIWFLCAPERRDALLSCAGFFAAPYDKAAAALCCVAAGADWPLLEALLAESYLRAQ